MRITGELHWANGMDILSVSCKGLGVTGEVKVKRVRCDVSRLLRDLEYLICMGFGVMGCEMQGVVWMG